MRIDKNHALRFGLTTAVFSLIFYCLLNLVYKSSVELNCHVKAFRNADLQLFYGKTSDFDDKDSHKKPLISSQFFKCVSFLIPDEKQASFLRLDLGDQENTIFITKIEIVVNNLNKRDTIKRWNGQELKQIIRSLNSTELDGESIANLQLKVGSDDPYILFNDLIAAELKKYSNAENHGLIVTLTSLLLGLFLATTYFYHKPALKLPSLKYALESGYGLVIGTCCLVFLIFLNNEFGFLADLKNSEKRKLIEKPSLSLSNFFEFPDLFSDYARDNFSFRNAFFLFNSTFKVNLFNVSPLPNDVIIGKNDWLFDTEPGCINDFRHMAQISPEELAAITVNMGQRKTWLANRNIKFYVTVPPNKHQVYPQFMPSCFFPTQQIGTNRLHFYKEHLKIHGRINLIDPTDSLRVASNRAEVYYKSDTHWNLFGGFKGYQVLINEIKIDFPQINPLKEEEFMMLNYLTSEGDLAAMIGLQEKFKRKEYLFMFLDSNKHLPIIDRSDVRLEYRNNKTIDGSNLKLVMFRDSYANYLMPFLNLHFKDAVYIWSYEFMDQIIEEEKPDVVIFESLQRFMPVAFLTPNSDVVSQTKIQ